MESMEHKEYHLQIIFLDLDMVQFHGLILKYNLWLFGGNGYDSVGNQGN